jgi:tripartite-type tricarboxylate transporter receptor subunit TctC
MAEHVKSGQVRLLATIASGRDPAFPDVPTARELGLDVSLEAWRGIAAPKGTPKAVIEAHEAAIKDTVESPEFAQACIRLGARPAFLPAARFGRLIAKEDGELAKLMEIIGLKK